MQMTHRVKSSNNRPSNPPPTKSHKDDDNCSVICYKDADDDQVGVVRIRQQPVCSACNLMRGTLALYTKHLLENNHRENVKKQCDENRFVPSIYDQAIHLAFQNNFYYQSEKFHFLYKNVIDESDSSAQEPKTVISDAKCDPNKPTPVNGRERRTLQVSLVFQEKTYSRTGMATAQMREDLLKEMLVDRAEDIAAISMDTYYTKKKMTFAHMHQNALKSSIILTMGKEQPQDLLKKQHEEEPLKNGVEQHPPAMTTQETSTAEPIDDVLNDCQDVLTTLTADVYAKSDEFKREQQFLSGVAQRNFKKKNTFICDVCSIFLTSEKYCIQHLKSADHLAKVRQYQSTLLPWRRRLQEALIVGKPMREIMGSPTYEDYKASMALYLAPSTISNRGRFCCGYCEHLFTDQWTLEKHLHSDGHTTKQAASTQVDHKELVVRFANTVTLPAVFKFNGVTKLTEIPDDVKSRYQWRCATRAQLDEDTAAFLRTFPLDAFEGVTRTVTMGAARPQQKPPQAKALLPNPVQRSRNNFMPGHHAHGRHGGLLPRPRDVPFQTPAMQRGDFYPGGPMKRPFPSIVPTNKRFRGDLNGSYSGGNRHSVPMRNPDMDQYHYERQIPYQNNQNRWPSNQPRQQFFERSNFELQSIAGNNNNNNTGFYPSNNYHGEPSVQFNRGPSAYNNQQSNYGPDFSQPNSNYHAEPNPSSMTNRLPQRNNVGPPNDFNYHATNNMQQQTQPSMGPTQNSNQHAYGAFGANSNGNGAFFSPSNNQKQNQMGANGQSIRSYADYRSSAGPASDNGHAPVYSSPSNSAPPPSRGYDDFPRTHTPANSSTNYARPAAPSFSHNTSRYSQFGQQTSTGASRGGSSARGRGGQFSSTSKPAGSTFSFSSTTNTSHNQSSMRGRGAAYRY